MIYEVKATKIDLWIVVKTQNIEICTFYKDERKIIKQKS